MIWKIIGNVNAFMDKCKRDKINAYSAQSAFFYYIIQYPFFDVVFLSATIYQYHRGNAV